MSGRRLVLLALALAVVAALVLPGTVRNFFFHENLHEIVPGIWRSAQPDDDELDRMIRELGLRSVLNLRGERGNNDWYANEVETTKRRTV